MAAPHQRPVSVQTSDRRSAGFDPSMWRDYFLSYSSSHSMAKDENAELEVEKLKLEVKEMLMIHFDKVNLFDKLDLVDQIQRLGIGYHFETEIDQLLNKIHTDYYLDDGDDLRTTSLMFRLLRQQGHYVSSDMFKRFRDENGKFKQLLSKDVRGLLSLYEASYLKIHGEEILEEALDFSTTHLNKFIQDQTPLSINPSLLAAEVSHALQMNLHKRTTRLLARDYIDLYRKKDSPNEVLLRFAILDFNLVQKLHQSELGYLTRWWKNLDMATKLPFARDRLVECYIWSLGVYFEPHQSFCRTTVTKVVILTSLMDDIYDLYGTLEEVSLLTSVIDRWEIRAVNEVPEFMQHFLLGFADVFDEIEEKLIQQGTPDHMRYAKEAFRIQAWAYFNEAKWYHQSHMPTLEEYMSVAAMSATFLFFTTIGYLTQDHIPNKESFEWLLTKPKMILASSVVGRLTNDIVSYKSERKRGDAPSAVDCYIEQHHVIEQEAIKALYVKIDNAWKDMNEECLFVPNFVQRSILFPMLNWARACYTFYTEHEDLYTAPNNVIKEIVDSVIINPILF